MLRVVVLMLVALACGARAATLVAPQTGAAQPVPVATPYDEAADAAGEVGRAFAAARRSGRLVLLDFGANWCPDCRVLAGMMVEPAVASFLGAHFETVRVDVGRFDRNMDLARRYGVTIKAIPALLVLTPDGRLLDPDGTVALGNARSMTTQAVVDLLAAWASR